MPLQNRITPFGNIIAHPARGTLMGNRGGRFHDPETRTLTSRRWASRQWIICKLEFKQRHRQVMANSYTELFFLDEVTALAAGHRPCFECRRDAAVAFFDAHQKASPAKQRPYAADMDKHLHAERLQSIGAPPFDPRSCPDGTVFNYQDDAWALHNGQLLHWTPNGYDQAIPLAEIFSLCPLTPATTIAILAHGYQPVWHSSATQFAK